MKAFKNTASVCSLIGLGVLLLLSPCKLRHVVQAELGLEQTQVSNKSQSFAPQQSCLAQDIAQTTATISVPDAPQFTQAGHFNFSLDFDVSFPKASIQNAYIRPNLASSVPLYILFSNFKVYL